MATFGPRSLAEQNDLSAGSLLMLRDRRTGPLATAALLCLSFCGSAPCAAESAYPRVQDQAPAREKPALTVNEQSKLKKELVKARDRQTSQVKARDGAAQAKSKKP
jgi:hypothetical protein